MFLVRILLADLFYFLFWTDLVDADESARQVPRELAEKVTKRHKFLFYEASKSLQRIFEFMIVKSVKSE
jgi:hypothetical protein